MGRGDNSTSIDVSAKRPAGATGVQRARADEQRNVADELRGTSDEQLREVDDAEPDTAQGAAFLTKLESDYRNQADLPAAFELIAEACAAVKIAEERVQSAEEALDDATSFYDDAIKQLTQKLNSADLRAEAAERQAAHAEEQLRIFCQTILTTMHKI